MLIVSLNIGLFQLINGSLLLKFLLILVSATINCIFDNFRIATISWNSASLFYVGVLQNIREHTKPFLNNMFANLRISKLEHFDECVCVCALLLIFRNFEIWDFEILKLWSLEILESWNLETLKLWNLETLKLWNFGTLELWWYLISIIYIIE